MVRHHEYRVFEGRAFTPPTLPIFVRPRAAERAEHISPHDRSAHAFEGLNCVAVVEPRAAFLAAAVHRLKGIRRKEPIHDLNGVFAERFGLTLLKAGAETIKGTSKATHDDFRHPTSSAER